MKTFFTISGLFCMLLTFSQSQILFNETKAESFLVQYQTSEGNSPRNHIVKSIADGIPKSMYSTKFSFAYSQKSMLVKTGNRLDFTVNLENINFTGDILYKGFPVSNYIFPGKVSYKLNWLTTSNSLIKSFDFENIELGGSPIVMLNFFETDSTSATNYKFEIVAKNFIYTPEDAKAFDDRLFLIDNYFASEVKMQQAHQELMLVKPDEIERIVEWKNIVDRTEALIQDIEKKNFNENLSLLTYDPLQFANKFMELKQIHGKVKIDVYYVLNNAHEIFYNRGLEDLSNNRIAKAEENFAKSINANMMFAPAHYQLARIYYNQGKSEESIQRIRDVLNKLNPDPDTKNLTLDLGKTIYGDLINNARKLSETDKFDEALVNLDNAKNICQTTSGMVCTEQLNEAYSFVLNSKYIVDLNNALGLINSNKLDEAGELIQKIKFFQKSNSSYVGDIKKLDDTELALFNAYVSEGKSLSQQKKYQEALEKFNKASIICSVNPTIVCSEELQNSIYSTNFSIYSDMLHQASTMLDNPDRAEEMYFQAVKYQEINRLEISPRAESILLSIKQKQYDNFVQEGYNFNKQKLYEQALMAFDKATVIEIAHKIKINSKLRNYIGTAAKSFSFTNIEEGMKKVGVNDLQSARKNYLTAKGIIAQYELSNDLELKKAMEELNGKIFSQECQNKLSEYNKIVEKAENTAGSKKYIEAKQEFEKALKFAKENEECEINTVPATDKLSEILPGAVYQQLFNVCKREISNGSYKNACEKYIELEKYYFENKVSVLGINHTEFHIFFLNQDAYCNQFMVNYYLDNSKLDKSLEMLHQLEKKAYNKKYSKNSQRTLGTQLAIADFKKSPASNPKHLVVNYTNGSKYYAELNKAYLKQWKKLD
ncbi:MAG: hypothetical protein JXR58_09040 [Bacteroidales bacterium]|nr:hypothetical protein [Bacteroidales bacterium]